MVQLRQWMLWAFCLGAVANLSGCVALREYLHNGFKVGPNYVEPTPPVAKSWVENDRPDLRKDSEDLSEWWTVFKIPSETAPDSKDEKTFVSDPALQYLIQTAYRQNLTLREAGYRILQARAQLAIAAGGVFPQEQFSFGSFNRGVSSRETAAASFLKQRYLSQWNQGFGLAWELDFWGRFRRAVESASAGLDASMHDYDDVVVTLLADVATNYIQIRTTQERIRVARDNVKIQEESANTAEKRKAIDVEGDLNFDQARTLLYQTKATIPELEITLKQSTYRLCTLLGMPPEDLLPELDRRTMLKAPPIPTAPKDASVGIPAELLRRRPDIRRAERQVAAQSAQIGIAKSDFYPQVSITGTLAFSAEHFKDLFKGAAFNGVIGPSFQWKVLNYGRILNNVRLQDARFQELIAAYQNSILNAQQEVEVGLATFLKARERAQLQKESEEFAVKTEAIVRKRQPVDAPFNYTRLTQTQQLRLQAQDLSAQAKGEIALGLIQVYRALGGGWQIRNSSPGSAPPPEPLPMVRAQFGAPQ